ncbi:MAG: AMP-binding protein, partial [Rhodospirillaceae bacterium]|nr:AMP-binding protein [Rhodospirillaceae bacterium]
MHNYATAHRDFRWDIPDTFNFAVDVVDRWAEDPDKLALIWCNEAGDERRLTYAEISQQSQQFANLLASQGITKGDTVIVMLPRIPAWQV